MKTLILTCSTGAGHNSAAAAIKEKYLAEGEECDIREALPFISQKASDFICSWHVRIYRYFPKLFAKGYAFAEKHPGVFGDGKRIYKYFASGSDKLFDYICEEKYDSLICTHAFAAVMVSEMLRKHGKIVNSCFVSTDYTCYPLVEETELDLYFIASPTLLTGYVGKGIPISKLRCSGIPTHKDFAVKTEKNTAKRTLGLDPDKKHILLMCGSMGCGPISDITSEIDALLVQNSGVQLSVICGTNRSLYSSLCALYETNKDIIIHGFVREMPMFFDSADVYITKPGGLSVSEAAIKGLPMVFINAVAGCEEKNLRLFTEQGAAVYAKTPEEIAKQSVMLCHNDYIRSEMCKNSAALSSPNAAEIIYKNMLAEAKNETVFDFPLPAVV